jgi:hypothetical protein
VFVERDKFDEEPDESTDIWPKDDNH